MNARTATRTSRVRRAEAPGARLASRWVRNFLVLSLPPAVIVSQLLLLLAFQLQAAAVVIVNATLPPDDPTDLLVGDKL